MSKKYKDYNQNQIFLFPPSPQDWLPEKHLAYFISDVVDDFDLTEIFLKHEKDHRGQPPYHPRMMVKILLYAYCTGVCSSRKISRMIKENIAFRYLAAGNYPDFRSISDFRKDNLSVIKSLFLQTLQIAQKAGLVKLGHVALDGTKIKANASKHKAMSYGRMKAKEADLKKEVDELLKKAYKSDKEEDKALGKTTGDDELPEELAFREKRLAKIQAAKKALEEEGKAAEEARKQEKEQSRKQDEKKDDKDNDDDPSGPDGIVDKPKASIKQKAGIPKDKAQRNFTDPESRIMKNADKAYIQGYNAQAAVDSTSQIIVAAEVTNQAADVNHLEFMVQSVKTNTGHSPKELSADAGYFSEDNIRLLEKEGIDAYIPPDKQPHSRFKEPAPRGRMPGNLSVKEKMQRKIKTKRGRKKYQMRQKTVEPVFGQIKAIQDFRQFLLRGLEKVQKEWELVCLAHNLKKLYQAFLNKRLVLSN